MLDLIFPPRCIVCDGVLKTTEKGICKDCRGGVHRISGPVCGRCGKELGFFEDTFCKDCRMHRHAFESGKALFLYNDAMRKSIYRFKYAGRKEYAAFYGKALADAFDEWIASVSPDAIVPIPLHKKRLAQRGFNQAELIARALSKHTGIPVRNDVLSRRTDTRKQKELNVSERENNLKKAFKSGGNDVKLDTVLLIDDIYTTGSTMDAAASCLKRSGVRRVHTLSLCIGRNI